METSATMWCHVSRTTIQQKIQESLWINFDGWLSAALSGENLTWTQNSLQSYDGLRDSGQLLSARFSRGDWHKLSPKRVLVGSMLPKDNQIKWTFIQDNLKFYSKTYMRTLFLTWTLKKVETSSTKSSKVWRLIDSPMQVFGHVAVKPRPLTWIP